MLSVFPAHFVSLSLPTNPEQQQRQLTQVFEANYVQNNVSWVLLFLLWSLCGGGGEEQWLSSISAGSLIFLNFSFRTTSARPPAPSLSKCPSLPEARTPLHAPHPMNFHLLLVPVLRALTCPTFLSQGCPCWFGGLIVPVFHHCCPPQTFHTWLLFSKHAAHFLTTFCAGVRSGGLDFDLLLNNIPSFLVWLRHGGGKVFFVCLFVLVFFCVFLFCF